MVEEKTTIIERISSKREQSLKKAKVSSSYKEHRENALASGAEEGRDKLRKATGSSKYA